MPIFKSKTRQDIKFKHKGKMLKRTVSEGLIIRYATKTIKHHTFENVFIPCFLTQILYDRTDRQYLETLKNNLDFFENCEYNHFLDLICKNCLNKDDEKYRQAAYSLILALSSLPVLIWTDKLIYTLCKCFPEKKVLQICMNLIGSTASRYHMLTLVTLVRKKGTEKCAIFVLKELLFGKEKIDNAKEFYRIFLLALLDVSRNVEVGVVVEVLKVVKESRFVDVDQNVLTGIRKNAGLSTNN